MSEPNLIEQFMSITGVNDQAEATNWLEMGAFDIESSVNLFFANSSSGGAGIGTETSSSVGRGGGGSMYSDSSSSGKRGFGGGDLYDEEGIRAPDQTKRMRLQDGPEFGNSRRPVMSTFTSGSRYGPSEAEHGLSNIFKPPHEIMFMGTFTEAKELGKRENKWLMVNIQQDSVFESHMLNRDVWCEETLQDYIASNFLFWQHFDVSSEGSQFCEWYKVDMFPLICIIDPRTGALKWKKEGFITAEKMGEKITDFLDKAPYPGADDVGANEGKSKAAAIDLDKSASSNRSLSNAPGFRCVAGSASESSDLSQAVKASLATTSKTLASANGGGPSSSSHTGARDTGDVVVVEDEEGDQEKDLPGFSARALRKAKHAAENPVVIEDSPRALGVTSDNDDKKENGDGDRDGKANAKAEGTDKNTGSSQSPDLSGKTVKIMFKLPSGSKVVHVFDIAQTIRDVAMFLVEKIEADDKTRFEVEIAYPCTKLSFLDHGSTLEKVGITKDTALMVRVLQ